MVPSSIVILLPVFPDVALFVEPLPLVPLVPPLPLLPPLDEPELESSEECFLLKITPTTTAAAMTTTADTPNRIHILFLRLGGVFFLWFILRVRTALEGALGLSGASVCDVG